MSLEQLATNFGLPGFLILIWYLLERARMARSDKTEQDKLVIENRKVDAMTIGFQTLGAGLVNVEKSVVRLDAKVDTLIDMGDRFTPPPQEVPRKPRTPAQGTPLAGGYSLTKRRPTSGEGG